MRRKQKNICICNLIFDIIILYMIIRQELSQPQFAQAFDSASINLHVLTEMLQKQKSIQKNTDSCFYNQAISITIQLQKSLHMMHEQHEKNIVQVENYQKQIKKTKHQLKISQIRRQDAQKKLISLQKQYLSACKTLLQKQDEVQQLKEFNKIDISYIPSFEVHLQEQDKLANSTEIYSEQNQFKCQKKSDKSETNQQKIQQQVGKERGQATYGEKQQNKEQKNMYDLLFQIQYEGFKQISDISIQNEREKQREAYGARNEESQQNYKEISVKKQKQINMDEQEQKSYEMNFLNLMTELEYNF